VLRSNKRRIVLAIAVTALLTTGIGSSAQNSTPPIEPELLPQGALPGKPVSGTFRGRDLALPHDVREVAVTGRGASKAALLLARGERGQLCFAVTVGVRGRKASFTCLRRWDRPPLLLRVAIGGKARDLIDWMALVGFVRQDVGAVTFESDRREKNAISLHAWSGFPWKAFAIMTRRRDHAHAVLVRDAAGQPVQDVLLGWAYGSPCLERHSPVGPVGGRRRRGAEEAGGYALGRRSGIRLARPRRRRSSVVLAHRARESRSITRSFGVLSRDSRSRSAPSPCGRSATAVSSAESSTSG
jgi:hypothetical protein